jgi:hypothetical protein
MTDNEDGILQARINPTARGYHLAEGVIVRRQKCRIAIYQHRDDCYGGSNNITLQNSSLWAGVADPINIGTHGNTANPETMSDVKISNIDILDHRDMQMLYQGCIAIIPGDINLNENVYIMYVRVENFRLRPLINMRGKPDV